MNYKKVMVSKLERKRLIKRIDRNNLNLNKTKFVIRKWYPAFSVDANLNVIINLDKFPKNITFNDIIFHIIRGDICERICFIAKVKIKVHFDCKTDYIDCIPMIITTKIMKELGLSSEFLYFNEYENKEG